MKKLTIILMALSVLGILAAGCSGGGGEAAGGGDKAAGGGDKAAGGGAGETK